MNIPIARVLWALSLGGIFAACTSTSDVDTRVGVGLPSGAPSASGRRTLALIEGSFDASTRTLHVSQRDPNTGAVRAESTIPYGTSPGDFYLHTEGVGDGRAGPQWNSGTQVLTANVDAENGTSQTLDATVSLTFVPATVGMAGGAACQGGALGAGSAAGPCLLGYGSVAPNAGFPSPVFTSPSTWTIDDSANGGASFIFSGTVDGVPSSIPPCTPLLQAPFLPPGRFVTLSNTDEGTTQSIVSPSTASSNPVANDENGALDASSFVDPMACPGDPGLSFHWVISYPSIPVYTDQGITGYRKSSLAISPNALVGSSNVLVTLTVTSPLSNLSTTMSIHVKVQFSGLTLSLFSACQGQGGASSCQFAAALPTSEPT